ncbi:MAG: ribosome silencing factor [Clostridia bacterium]|nr:ribosome silencing factor [Clostridia bacterium]
MERVQKIAQALYDKKASNIVGLDISEITTMASYFVICSCGSTTQLRACADEVEEKMEELGILPKHKEGYNGGTWILMDYSDIIVHIMTEETREFYSLEHLWADAADLKFDLK